MLGDFVLKWALATLVIRIRFRYTTKEASLYTTTRKLKAVFMVYFCCVAVLHRLNVYIKHIIFKY